MKVFNGAQEVEAEGGEGAELGYGALNWSVL